MAKFAAYLIKNTKVDIAATIITADSGAAAIKQTKPLVDGHDTELWQGQPIVMGFKVSRLPSATQLQIDQTRKIIKRGQDRRIEFMKIAKAVRKTVEQSKRILARARERP